jgi:hypothetical protein
VTQPHIVGYESSEPLPENAFKLFSGAWSSRVPGLEGPGVAELFDDHRIKWMIEELGSIAGYDVLELGPLEAGHTYMLEKSGANILAIEANFDAFMRCLIVKNRFDLKSKFVLGDFARSFGTIKQYDLVIASGVLYHMSNPVDLLQKIAGVTNRIFLWTHYWEENISLWAPNLQAKIGTKWRPQDTQIFRIGNFPIRAVPQLYEEALGWAGFCGGPEQGSSWIYREDLLAALRALGFNDIRISFEAVDHQNGPSFCILAQR